MGEDAIEYELKSYIKIGEIFWTAMIINGKIVITKRIQRRCCKLP